MFRRIGIVFLMALLMAACAPQGVDEACCVVAEADSLWQAGQTYDDSLRLAQAYETLSSFCSPLLSTLHPKRSTDYAHACYHYGCLLRRADDPVAAMQVFISGTHSGTKDYHILGRIYSNMGDLCHLASEFQLSYDMYERSAHYFLENGDTLLYYYGLNNMAYELAEQGEKDATLAQLKAITENCWDKDVLYYTFRTKAILYRELKDYPLALLSIDSLCQIGTPHPSDIVIKAQAFEALNQQDSALRYAKYVMGLATASEQDRYNMLYIIMNDDSSLSNDSMLQYTAQRSDIETDVLNPLFEQLAVAKELLIQDLTRQPDLRWLYAIIITLIVVGTLSLIYIRNRQRKHQLLSQEISDLSTIRHAEQQQYHKTVEQHVAYKDNLRAQIERNCELISQSDTFPQNICWKDYKKMCEIVNNSFGVLATKLQTTYSLSEKEVRLCVLVLLGSFSDKQMAEMLFYSYNSIRSTKRHVAIKLGSTSANLRSTLIDIALQ